MPNSSINLTIKGGAATAIDVSRLLTSNSSDTQYVGQLLKSIQDQLNRIFNSVSSATTNDQTTLRINLTDVYNEEGNLQLSAVVTVTPSSITVGENTEINGDVSLIKPGDQFITFTPGTDVTKIADIVSKPTNSAGAKVAMGRLRFGSSLLTAGAEVGYWAVFVHSAIGGAGEKTFFVVDAYNNIQYWNLGNNVEQMRLTGTGLGIHTAMPTSPLQVVGLSTFASNVLALAGGLTVGAFYSDGAGAVKVVF